MPTTLFPNRAGSPAPTYAKDVDEKLAFVALIVDAPQQQFQEDKVRWPSLAQPGLYAPNTRYWAVRFSG
jgi:hypothetical protein